MIECIASVLAIAAGIGWMRERYISREWAKLCGQYSRAYCDVVLELAAERRHHLINAKPQEQRWLN